MKVATLVTEQDLDDIEAEIERQRGDGEASDIPNYYEKSLELVRLARIGLASEQKPRPKKDTRH